MAETPDTPNGVQLAGVRVRIDFDALTPDQARIVALGFGQVVEAVFKLDMDLLDALGDPAADHAEAIRRWAEAWLAAMLRVEEIPIAAGIVTGAPAGSTAH